MYGILSGEEYEPKGGIFDLVSIMAEAKDLSDAIESAMRLGNHWLQVIWFDDNGVALLCYIACKTRMVTLWDDMSLPIDNIWRSNRAEMPFDEWLTEHIASRTCGKCDAPPGRCYCPAGLFFNGKPLGAEIDMQKRMTEDIEVSE